MEKAVIQYNEARARLMMDIIPPAALRAASHGALAYNTRISRKREYIRTIFLLFAVFLLTLMAFSAARASTTISYFNDSELSLLNTLRAGILNFLLGDSPSADISVTAGEPASEPVTPTVTLDAGSFPLRYKVTSLETGGNSAFCAALQVNSVSGPFVYAGPLIGMDTGEATTTGPWQFTVSFADGAPGVADGDTCVVDLVYSGWIDGESASNGYLDEELFMLTVHAVVPAPINAPLLMQSAVIEEPQALSVERDVPLAEGEEEARVEERGTQDEQTDNTHENNGRGEERSDERGTERERTAEPPAEVIVETVDVPPAAETPAVTETLPVPEDASE